VVKKTFDENDKKRWHGQTGKTVKFNYMVVQEASS